MDNLYNKIIAYLGRTPDFDTEVKLVDDGDGKPYIAEWNATDKTKPTDDELNAVDTEATKLENNAILSPYLGFSILLKSVSDIGAAAQLIGSQNTGTPFVRLATMVFEL